MNSNQHEIKSQYELELEMIEYKFKNNKYCSIFTKLTTLKHLLIYVTYYPHTDANQFKKEIEFLITIIPDNSNISPIVNILNTFVFPSLCDNRNLLESILLRNWNCFEPYLSIVFELFEKMPLFIGKLISNIQERKLIYYGKYDNEIYYNMNDFLESNYNKFYKIYYLPSYQRNDITQRNAYLIITDIYLLVFDYSESIYKNCGKLIQCNKIVEIKNYATNKYYWKKQKYSLLLTFENENLSLEFVLEHGDNKEVIALLKQKKKWINERYDIFRDEYF